MKKQASRLCLIAVVCVSNSAGADSPDAGSHAETQAAAPTEVAIPYSFYTQGVPTKNAETFEFDLVPWARPAFPSQQAFVNALNNFGAMGFGSIMHVVNDLADEADDERFLMRSVQADFNRVFEYGIEVYQVDPDDPIDIKVPEWDRLGGEGKLIDFLFMEGGVWYLVSAATLIDGQLLTWGWDLRRAGKDGTPTSGQYKKAAKKLAKNGYMPITIGLNGNLTKYYVVGIGETTFGAPKRLKLRFQSIKLSLSAQQFLAHVAKNGRKGFRLADVQMFGSPDNALMVFAQIKENGKKTKRRDCAMLGIDLSPPGQMVGPLNTHGATGRRVDFIAALELSVAPFFDPYFVLCDASQSTHRY